MPSADEDPARRPLAVFEQLAEQLPEGTSGVAVAIGESPVLLEVLAGPRTFASVFRKLLSRYAFEAVGLGRRYGTPNPSAVRSFIEAAAKVAHEEHQAVGAGRDLGLRAYRRKGRAARRRLRGVEPECLHRISCR